MTPIEWWKVRAELDDALQARDAAAAAADRFRDVLIEALGLREHPGDDGLVQRIRAMAGRAHMPEPTRHRDAMARYRALMDAQADARSALPAPGTPFPRTGGPPALRTPGRVR